MHYRITVRGHVGSRVSPVFPDLVVEDRDDRSVMTGPVKDQTELHGIIALIRDLNAPLIAIELMRRSEQPGVPTDTHRFGP